MDARLVLAFAFACQVFEPYKTLLVHDTPSAHGYVTKRLALKLLGEILLHRR